MKMRFIRIKKRRDQEGTQVKLMKWNTKGLNRDKFAVQPAHTYSSIELLYRPHTHKGKGIARQTLYRTGQVLRDPGS
jgi:hypothetical protein